MDLSHLVQTMNSIPGEPAAARDKCHSISARERATVRDAIERHLRVGSERTSRSRIRRLRGIRRPQYRLRVGEIRVFYDIGEKAVEILAIIPKSRASEWLTGRRGGKG